MSETIRVAIAQSEPHLNNLEAGIDRTLELMDEAATAGAQLIAFPELWLPGYPSFLWQGDARHMMSFTRDYVANSLRLGSEQHRRIERHARVRGLFVMLGYSELDGSSLYIGQMLIDPSGITQMTRRKLKATAVERTLFGEGDGSDLVVTETEIGRVGGLSCWEHLLPLAKFAMYAQSEQIHVAAWPAPRFTDDKDGGFHHHHVISRGYAIEGGTFVLVATHMTGRRTAEYLFGPGGDHEPELEGGSSRIYGPHGNFVAGPLAADFDGLLVADLNLDEITMAKNLADPAGHYARSDVTRLWWDSQRRREVVSPHAAE